MYRRRGSRASTRKKVQKGKMVSEEALQIAEKRKVKGKGINEIYTPLNTEFQKIQGEIQKPSSVISAKRQRKTIEWKSLEISSRKLDTKGTFHAKMGSIKDRNGRDLPNRSRRY